MHPNPAFRQEPEFLNLHLARKRGFGTLVLNGDPLPLVSHVPFALDDAGKEAELHLVRSNPIARAVTEATPAVIAVSGPDGYVSPDWYGAPAQVPTWNYVAVHLRGKLIPSDPQTMRDHLEKVSAQFEERLPKRPWTVGKMPEDTLERMMRQILPFRFEIEEVDGTWKLNQNKTDSARESAAEAIRHSPIGHEVETLSWLMKGGVPEIDKDAPVTYI
ncbi:FMN-binding negative transcriptional regulator [Maritalea mobilis]|uniref:FMN-binding negative transcriptional regulator n=1 Tax=Maritalea mobilis TaxID=483324 RepID=UPI001C94A931|nr:FMN-binding negative transcriptional regulator [Maritalea mobilis]MBY6202917.1 FMN-binding negative transcriptional regulator [Maritalea mobilis]